MVVGVPAVKVPLFSNHHVDAAHEGRGAVYDRDLLMKRLNGVVSHAVGTVIQ
jgi:hypothetical protein